MEILRTSLLWAFRILVTALLSSLLHAETVIPCLQQTLPLNQRWDWAKKEAQIRISEKDIGSATASNDDGRAGIFHHRIQHEF